eukprot:9498607-Pyramimonas_sp.AAC.1
MLTLFGMRIASRVGSSVLASVRVPSRATTAAPPLPLPPGAAGGAGSSANADAPKLTAHAVPLHCCATYFCSTRRELEPLAKPSCLAT